MTTTTTAAAAGTWQLGDLPVNRLGFGAMRLTGTAAFDQGTPRDRETSIRVLRRAVELGVNHIDTASFYFSWLRSANELINSALNPYADDLVVVTKVGPGRGPDGEWYTATPEQLRGQVEENLRQLGRDHLDVVNLRRQVSLTSVSEHFGALAELQQAGLIRHLGVSNVNATHLAEAQAIAPVVCVQNKYHLDGGANNEMLRLCGEQGIAFVPFYAIAGQRTEAGVAAAPGESEQVETVARAHGVSTAQVRLAWTLSQGPHVLAIPGTGDPAHLEDNVAAAALRLTPEDLALLATVTG
ncbi:oxidoreductase [Kitasatospora sp. NPDC002227]|uniref:oxidoreductase n=1 Tax=Kitasatospora sp. NPDC002227 TaxID=3154773 RepID=UPI00332E17BC